MIYTVTLNPALDKTVEVPDFTLNAVNRTVSVRRDPGGKGLNVSKVIRALGGESRAFCILGGAAGGFIRSAAEGLGVPVTAFSGPGETRTNTKIVDRARHTNTDLNETGLPVPPETLRALRDALLAAALPGDTAVLAGSLPPGTAPALYRDWTSALKKQGVRVFLDTDGEPLRTGAAAAPYAVKPNRDELARLCGRPLPTLEDVAAEAARLCESGIEMALISLGGDGALLAMRSGGVLYTPGLTVPVASTVGAGDAMTAAFALALADGQPPAGALKQAAAVSAAAVMTEGTQAPAPGQVQPLLRQVQVKKLR